MSWGTQDHLQPHDMGSFGCQRLSHSVSCVSEQGETADELSGLAKAMLQVAIPVQAGSDGAKPLFPLPFLQRLCLRAD